MAARKTAAKEGAARYLVGPDAEFDPTPEQNAIIKSDVGARLLVDAGPGTGKTATACARIAWLINECDIEPTSIWLVSFTRTAVHELRNRIANYVGDGKRSAGIRIATIDSHAWAIQSGFRKDATLTGSFEDNIENVIEMVKSHEGVFEELAAVEHLVVDEAQDIVGPRCELLLEIINALSEQCGVSVFSDEAQAIYGFSEEDEPGEVDGTLPEMIRANFDDFTEMDLSEIRRTSDRVLKGVFMSGRGILRQKRHDGASKLKLVRELIEEKNHGHISNHRTDLSDLPDDLSNAFLLFRRRGEALEASGYLGCRPHRLRMSGLPNMIHDWVGRSFWDWTQDEMDRNTFEARWQERMSRRADVTMEFAWNALLRLVGLSDSRISVSKLSRRLAGGSPPVDLCNPDFGPGGPVIGTIHGAKGREADEVRVYLPPVKEDQDDNDAAEEARVVFVAATRAKERLLVGTGATRALARRLDSSGRAFTPYPFSKGRKEAKACVEVGRDGDVDAEGLAGKAFFGTAAEVRKAQASSMMLVGKVVEAMATASSAALGYRYVVQEQKGKEKVLGSPLCYLSKRLNHDLFRIAGKVNDIVGLGRTKPPAYFSHVRLFGVRTLVVAPDDPARELLHAPWRDSGFLLAPLVIGYSMAYFRGGKWES